MKLKIILIHNLVVEFMMQRILLLVV